MNFYSYLIEHDFGLAPNPFGKYCTLAVCKPKIRKSNQLHVGDWIVGTGSKALEKTSGKKLRHHLIYAMQVSEIITMQEYWEDSRFEYKKPIINGTLVTMYGDNFYHLDSTGKWRQENSAHSMNNGEPNEKHLLIDTGGKNVIIGDLFYYFGDNAPLIPDSLKDICHTTVGEKKLSAEKGDKLIDWIKSNFNSGILGDPVNWCKYKQQKLF